MYERAFLDVADEPYSEWWHSKSVSSLKIREPVTVSAVATIQSVLDIMHQKGFDQVPVISEDG
jgi:CBS domain-containing protein